MRGKQSKPPNMFYALDVEALIRPDHPLRKIKQLVDEDLSHMGQLFSVRSANPTVNMPRWQWLATLTTPALA